MNDVNKLSLVRSPTQVRYYILAWFCSLSMMTYIDRVCIMQVQDDIMRDLNLTQQQFAWAFSMFALAYALFEVPSGWIGDRIGPRKVLARIVLCWLFFTALTGAVWSLASLVIVRFLFGAGEAGAYPNMAKGARNWFPFSQRGLAQGMIWTFGRWGGAVAPPLVILLALPFGWRGAFVILGVIGVFWVAAFWRYFRDTPHEHPSVNDAERALIETGTGIAAQTAPMSWASILRSPTLWILSIMYFCSNSGWSFFITYVTPYLKNDLQLSGWQLHLAAGAPLFCGGVGCMFGGLFTDRQVRYWGRRWGRTLQGIVAYALGGIFFLVAFAMTTVNPLLAFASLCFASFVKDFAMGASWSTTIDIGHRYSGTVAGVMNTIGNLGTVVSPLVVTQMVVLMGEEESGKLSVGLYYYSTMFFVAAFCWLFINPKRVIVYKPEDHERLRLEGVIT
jgi:MFS family permease